MVGEICSRGIESRANICTEGQFVAVIPFRWEKGIMRAPQEGIDFAAVRNGSQDPKANLLYDISRVCFHVGGCSYFFASPEHRPLVPWRDPDVTQPCTEVGVADCQWNDRRCELGCACNVKQR